MAPWAVTQVQTYGGVLEHPADSQLWPTAGLFPPGTRCDAFSGWTLQIFQWWFGHRAQKNTRLYIVGCPPKDLPPLPYRLGTATHIISSLSTRKGPHRPEVTKAEREQTPLKLAQWLVEVAHRCRPP